MQNFSIHILFQIIGIGAASGLVYYQDCLFIISDDSSFLYEYNIKEEAVNKIRLDKYSQENTPKKEKRDFEAITLYDNKLYIFGSGSTHKRETRFIYDLKTKEVQKEDFTAIYKNIRKATSISKEDFNIEGAFYNAGKWYLFQRGNGCNAKNGIIVYDTNNNKIAFTAIVLPKIEAFEATFTDAILVNDTIYFLAAAENSNSTYNDGEILGSLFGSIKLETLEVINTHQVSNSRKFEGLTLYKNSETAISFLLCEDNDTSVLQSDIFELTFKK